MQNVCSLPPKGMNNLLSITHLLPKPKEKKSHAIFLKFMCHAITNEEMLCHHKSESRKKQLKNNK
jgi:hypothetical protein